MNEYHVGVQTLFILFCTASAFGGAIAFAAAWFCFRPVFAYCEMLNRKLTLRGPGE